MEPTNHRRAAILSAPWLLLLALLAALAVDVVRLNHLDHDALAAAHERAYGRHRSHKPNPVDLSEGDSPVDVFAFGGSSLAMGAEEFEEHLEAEAGVHLHNYALIGATSGALVQRVGEAFDDAARTGVQPEMLLIYSGHNDYSYPYLDGLYRELGTLNAVRVLWWLRFLESDPSVVGDGFPWFQRMRTPAMARLGQQLGLVRWESEDFAPHMERSLRHFEENLDQILAIALRHQVPVTLVTPIGNLTWEPFGPVDTVTERFREGMAAVNRAERLDALVAARDGEVLTADMRAKSSLHRALVARRGEGVFVFDLQRRLESTGFSFDDEHFRDYLHFTDAGFSVLAKEIAAFWRRDPSVVLGSSTD